MTDAVAALCGVIARKTMLVATVCTPHDEGKLQAWHINIINKVETWLVTRAICRCLEVLKWTSRVVAVASTTDVNETIVHGV